MILADTSIWVDHLRHGNTEFAQHLVDGVILIHPLIICELACGNLSQRQQFLTDLGSLPQVVVATDNEVRNFIETRRLYGLGIGCIDAHLLTAARLSHCQLWTSDKALERAASQAGVALYRKLPAP